MNRSSRRLVPWSVIQGTGTFSNVNDPFATVTDLSLGVNIFRWTSDIGPCFQLLSDDVEINVELANSVGAVANDSPVVMWFDNNSGVLRIAGDVQANFFSIVNAVGQQVAIRATPHDGSLDLSDLPSGNYSAIAYIDGERRTIRFVVMR